MAWARSRHALIGTACQDPPVASHLSRWTRSRLCYTLRESPGDGLPAPVSSTTKPGNGWASKEPEWGKRGSGGKRWVDHLHCHKWLQRHNPDREYATANQPQRPRPSPPCLRVDFTISQPLSSSSWARRHLTSGELCRILDRSEASARSHLRESSLD
jgi:hypothetical protein